MNTLGPAQYSGIQSSQDPTTLGMPASYVFDSQIVFPNAMHPVFTGSTLGVPAVDEIAGETPSSGTAGSQAQYGAATAANPPHRQPIFWAVVSMVLGTLVLGHAAKVANRA